MRKLQSSDILPLIYNYLLEIGLPKIAKKISKESGIDLSIQNVKIKMIFLSYLIRKKHSHLKN